jgi:hypothetical protein
MRPLFVVLLALYCAAAAAQLRTIPEEAQLGTIRYIETSQVELDGEPRSLAPGAQIRDIDNRLMLPVALPDRETVRYLLDGSGAIRRVWLLTEQEKAALPPPPWPFRQ